MKLLIDTNIFIPLEPTSASDMTPQSTLGARLTSLAPLCKCELWLHPAQRIDIDQDIAAERRNTRRLLFEKYPVLSLTVPSAPAGSTNDFVDGQLIEALTRNAVDALVTEDKSLTRRATAKIGTDRILSLADAVALLSGLVDIDVQPPPVVSAVKAYELDENDPIWKSFREDYPGFDNWFQKCQRSHRPTWVIRSEDGSHIAGVAIVNLEEVEPRGAKTLKICSLKVDDKHAGRRFGELLLKSVFNYAYANEYDSLFISVFPKYDVLIRLLSEFGFEIEPERKEMGELVLAKKLLRGIAAAPVSDALDYHIKYGPYAADILSAQVFVVPIRPQFHRMLFPDLQLTQSLFPGREAYGNSIKKAYLSRSVLAPPKPGSVLLFYRSDDEQTVRSLGVVEAAIRSSEPGKIGGFVIPRTVYTNDEISAMCSDREVLAIRFRQCLLPIASPITLHELIADAGVGAAPQSITTLKEESKQWLIERLMRPS